MSVSKDESGGQGGISVERYLEGPDGVWFAAGSEDQLGNDPGSEIELSLSETRDVLSDGELLARLEL